MKNLFAILIFLIAANMKAQQSVVSIIPTPQSSVTKSSKFKITSQTKIILGRGNQIEEFIAGLINDELREKKETQLKVTDANSIRKLSTNYIFIGKAETDLSKKFLKERKGKLTKTMLEEGYFLDVDGEGITIIAGSDNGLFYGVQSLLQLFQQEKRSIVVHGISIHDFPAQKIRGITDDISRGQVSTIENFKKIIRFCARYKMNVYSPYIEDMFQFKNHPEIGKGRGALSDQECKELDAYGKKYFVELIPIFETLGHWENILLHPNYAKFGEFSGSHTINISDEKALALLDEMIGEIAACFTSPYFNIAADESWDVGLGANKAKVKKSDIATVHAEHYKRVFAMVKKYGKKPMMYGDIILDNPEILKKISADVTFVDWHYEAASKYSSPEIFKKAGFPYVVSPAISNFNGPFPNYLNTFVNIQNLNDDGFINGSSGMLCSNWNDYGGEALRELNYYGYAWSAECAWNPQQANTAAFNRKFFSDFFGEVADDVQAIYSILNSPGNQYHWNELWRHPMLGIRENSAWDVRPPILARVQSIQSTMPFVLDKLEKIKNDVKRNADHLQYLKFVAHLNLWFAKKIQTQEGIKILLVKKDSVMLKGQLSSKVSLLCKEVIDELTNVKTEFEKVWHTTNKTPMILLLQARYDRQILYWSELNEQVKNGIYKPDPLLESTWIYHPKANPYVKDTIQVQKAFLRKIFIAPKNIRSAKIQLIGDTWSKLWINGKQIGEVYARRSLSLMVESERVKLFDITSVLNDSLNMIALESQQFNPNRSAGVNIYCEIQLKDGSVQQIVSDASWKVTDKEQQHEWNKVFTYDSSWVNASPKNYPWIVIKPNFSTNRTSWIER